MKKRNADIGAISIFRWFVIWFFSRDKRVSFSGVCDHYRRRRRHRRLASVLRFQMTVFVHFEMKQIQKYPLIKLPRSNHKQKSVIAKKKANSLNRNS